MDKRQSATGDAQADERVTTTPNVAAAGMFTAMASIGALQVLTILAQFVRAKVISVELGPSGLGIVGLIDQLIQAVGFAACLSLPTIVVRVMPRVYGEPAFRRQYASFLHAVVIVSVVGSGALGIALIARPSLFGDVVAAHTSEFAVGLVSIPFFALGLFLPNVLAASMRPVGAVSLSFGIAAMTTVGAIAGLLWGGIREIYIAQAVLTGTLLLVALVYFKVRLQLPFHHSSAGLVREIRARPDIIPTAGAVYATLVSSSVSLLVIRYVTVHSVGSGAGGQLQAILSMVLGVGQVMVVMASGYLAPLLNRPRPQAEKFAIFDRFRHRQLIVLITLAVPLVVFAKLALTILFSSKFTDAALWLPAFLVWQLVVIQTNVQLQLLFALDELRIVAIKSIAGCVLSVALCIILIPKYGLSGAAIATIPGALLTLWIGSERLHRHGYVMARSSVWLGAYAAVVLLAAPYAMRGQFWDPFAVKIAACVVLIGGLWPFLDAEEKAAIRRFARRSTAGRSARS